MDALQFIKERRRMCVFYKGSCSKCPAKNCICFNIDEMSVDDRIVDIIEKWAAEHPVKTRQSEFLKQWPNAERDKNGWVNVCPKRLTGKGPNEEGSCYIVCSDCLHAFWSQEVE